MGKSKKGGLLSRRRAALARLEKQYEEFKTAGVDKQAWDTYRRGRVFHHKFRTFADECSRMSKEIAILKERINHHVG